MTPLFATLVIAVSLAGLGAQQPDVPRDGLPEGGPDMTQDEVQKIFDGYLVMQAQQALDLTDPQFAQFVPRLKVLLDARRRNQQERFRLLNELQRLTGPRGARRADEGGVKERLAALQELEARSAAELRKAYNGLDDVLDVWQQARFRVFEEQIERKKLDLLLRARRYSDRPNQPRRPPR